MIWCTPVTQLFKGLCLTSDDFYLITAIVSFTSTTREQIDAATNHGVKVHSWNEFLEMVSLLRFYLHILTISNNQEIIMVALLSTKTDRKIL